MLKSPPSWKWTGGSFQKHSHSEWILRRDRGEKFPKFNQSYGKAFESSRPSSPHNHSFVRGHLNNWNGICVWGYFSIHFCHLVLSTGGQTRQGKQFELKVVARYFNALKSFLITCSSEQIKTLWGSAPTLIFWNWHFLEGNLSLYSFYSPRYLWSKSSP